MNIFWDFIETTISKVTDVLQHYLNYKIYRISTKLGSVWWYNLANKTTLLMDKSHSTEDTKNTVYAFEESISVDGIAIYNIYFDDWI